MGYVTSNALLKTRLGIPTEDTADDALLNGFIAHCHGRFERQTTRLFGYSATHAEEFHADHVEVVPVRFPVLGTVTFAIKSTEAEGWIAQSNVDYLLRRECIISLAAPLGDDSQVARATFAAGYDMPGDAATGGRPLPDEIREAANEQCAYWYQNRNRLGVTSMSNEVGAITQFSSLDLLPAVKAVLSRYERWAS